MKNRAIKLVICICVISCLMVGFCTSFASAEPAIVTRAKAGVAAVMLAANLFLHPIDVALSEPYASAVDPEGRIEWVETFPEYLERSKIRVYPDVVTIDGVPYTDIWLGPEAAETLRLKGLDFATAYNIINNQSTAISYAQGVGTLGNVLFYSVDGVIRSPSIDFSQSEGESHTTSDGYTDFYYTSQSQTAYNSYIKFNSDAYYTRATVSKASGPPVLTYRIIGTSPRQNLQANYGHINGSSIVGPTVSKSLSSFDYDDTPFSFDYTSGVIDAPLNPDDGLLIRVPSSHTGSSAQDSYDIHDIVNDYPDVATPQGHTVEIDPELNPDFETDINLGNGIGDLIRTILILLDVLDNIDIEFAPEPTDPEPPGPGIIDPLPDPNPAPDDPVSGTTIADTDWTKLDEILRWIQSTIDSIRHITESLQTMLDSLFDQIQQIIESLQSLPEQLLEDIETGPSKVFRKAIDVLKSLFMPLLLPIKAMMGLWHYVVEWIQSISSPFTWIFGVMSGTSYNMVLPIYAVLAGSICIAIYKALGR